MRLASCIAVELTTGVVLMGGLASSLVWGVAELRKQTEAALDPVAQTDPAVASASAMNTSPPQSGVRPESQPEPEFVLPGQGRPAGVPGARFAGRPDQELLVPIREGTIARARIGTCCSSLNLRLDFDNGASAAFKPRQTNLGSMPRKEIAAYRMDRLLGLGGVPPALGRRFRVDEIRLAIRGGAPEDRQRFENELVAETGQVDGVLSWWIPALTRPKVSGMLIDTPEGVARWQSYLTIGNQIPEEEQGVVAQISNVLLFDFVINNIDRWSGSNVLASADGAILYYMDNTMAFRPQPSGHSKVNAYLRRSQKFSRSLVARLRDLRLGDVRAVMALEPEPFEYLLTEPEIIAILARRDAALDYVERLIAGAGEGAVLVFP